MRIIDSHTHVNDERLIGERDQIIRNLESQGIESIIEMGCDIDTSKAAYELSVKYANVYSAVGIHPHSAKERKLSDYDYMRSIASSDKVVAIGEVGLDYYYDLSDREEQKTVFKEQIELADELRLPLVLHIRDAYKDLEDILKDMKGHINSGLLLHCYSGSSEFVKVMAKYDAYFALGGAVTFKNAKKEDVIKTIPQDRLLIETDCPYLAPTPMRGSVNKPEYVIYTLKKTAETLNMDCEKLGDITYENTHRLFSKMKRTTEGSYGEKRYADV